ncbi:MAG: hypothetical protein KDD65_15485 [Bacteroidetes bacterium]|nr:hypothetical protein [Bacteroidota bacterium]
MKLITIKSNSIQTALAEAREQHGDDIILIESRPATGTRQAEIVVALEAASSGRNNHLPQRNRVEQRRPFPSTAARGYSVDDLRSRTSSTGITDAYVSQAAAAAALIGTADMAHSNADPAPTHGRGEPAATTRSDEPDRGSFSSRLISAANKIADRVMRSEGASGVRNGTHDEHTAVQHNVVRDIDTSTKRAEGDSPRPSMREHVLRDSAAFAGRWYSNPLFVEMVDAGYSVDTTISLLATLSSRGVPANADTAYLRAKVYDEIRRRNKTTVAQPAGGRHLFIGDAGSGKSNLILKAASDLSLRSSGRTLVLTTGPLDERGSSAAAYANAGVETLHVHSSQQLAYSLEVLERYDTLLIDSPGLSTNGEMALAEVRTLIGLLESLDRLTVHLVVDARRDMSDMEHQVELLSESVDALALAHLDGLTRKGRMVEFLLQHSLPVFFASSRRFTTGSGLDRFSPFDLAADSLQLDRYPYTDSELDDYFNRPASRTVGMNFIERRPINGRATSISI